MKGLRLLPLMALVLTVPVYAGGETIRLDDGQSMLVMHPGVDGVDPPRSIPTSAVSPRYPASAFQVDVDSSVTVAVLVRADGTVAETTVVSADHPNRGFEEAAAEAAREWRFRPAQRGGETVNSYAFVRLNFRKPENIHGSTFGVTRLRQGGQLIGSATLGAGDRLGVFGSPNRAASHRGGVQAVEIPRAGYGELYLRPYPTPLPASGPAALPRVRPVQIEGPHNGG